MNLLRASRSAAAAVGSSSNRLTAVRTKKLVRVFSGLQLQKAAQQLDSKARHVEWEKQTYSSDEERDTNIVYNVGRCRQIDSS